ncbi:hypothetical protein [Ralstonia pseudosolanacearum]|uniref:hypothetical protein n=1 Tax=Ralstonia pseudosolanacearum TaxID=1310165 RepID=UPI001F40AE32|nr:hypothetical protein [Ralstonia pseudosolanacearum]
MNRIDLEIVVASDASASMDPLRQELIRAQRRVQLDQPAWSMPERMALTTSVMFVRMSISGKTRIA